MSLIWFDGRMRESPPWFPVGGETLGQRDARESLGAWVIAARRRLGCSQADFGAVVGLPQSTISRIEHGQIRSLRFKHAVQLLVLIIETFVGPRPPAAMHLIA